MIGNQRKVSSILLTFVIIIGLGIMRSPIYAANEAVTLAIDDQSLELGVSGNLTLTAENMNGATIKSIEGIENFDIISQSQSNATQIINGSASTQIKMNYIIMPKEVGEFQLQGTVEYKGTTYQTNIITLNVSEKSESLSGEQADLFIQTSVSKDEIYFGEKIVVNYELYSRYNISDFGFLEDVSFDGFISNEGSQDEVTANYTTINGNKYVKYEVLKTYLTPTSTGNFEIPSFNIQVNVSTGDFFNSSTPYYFQTDSAQVTVLQVPKEGRPENYSGIIGELSVDAQYSKETVAYGDSLALHVSLSGNCNLAGFDEVIGDNIPGFSVYETAEDLIESTKDDQYYAQKDFNIILVPETTGELTIDPIVINYFNPSTREYETVSIEGKSIQVTGEVSITINSDSSNTTTTNSVETQQISINQVNSQADEVGYITIRLKQEYIMIALIVIALLFIALIVFRKVRTSRRKRKDKLRNIYNEIQQTTDLSKIYNLFNEMIKYRYGVSLKADDMATIKERLSDEKIQEGIIEIVDFMENKRFQKINETFDMREKISEIYKHLSL
jgi:hypothetical protein